MPSVKLYHGDNLDIFPLLEDESVDTVITDPPYGLKFMGKEWDHGVPGVRYWAECLRVSKPGAMLCAFGGTRTHHRLMCAIEDAGWEIRDVLMYLYGSGFPKSHAIGKAIDKAAGAEREVVGLNPHHSPGRTVNFGDGDKYGVPGRDAEGDGKKYITSPATDAAALWDGYGTALKPAYEPIILAMKPLPGTFAQNALGYGVAGLNVDGCRVATDWSTDPTRRGWQGGNSKAGYESIVPIVPGDGLSRGSQPHNGGRWPANLLLSHAPGCECVGVRKVKGNKDRGLENTPARSWKNKSIAGINRVGYADPDGTETVEAWNCVPECPVRLLDEQSGERPSNYRKNGRHNRGNEAAENSHTAYGHYGACVTNAPDDTGGASRFFTRFHYSAKASRAERELGLLGHIPCLKCGELDSVTHINPKTGKEEKCRRNGHPTVKPLDVCRWLCRLTRTPTRGVVLDPFMGSGRIPMAAILEGRDTIGIELERPSFEIAQAAVQWAEEQVPNMVQGELEHA